MILFLQHPVELEGFRKCHIRDGAAVVSYLTWLDAKVIHLLFSVMVLESSLCWMALQYVMMISLICLDEIKTYLQCGSVILHPLCEAANFRHLCMWKAVHFVYSFEWSGTQEWLYKTKISLYHKVLNSEASWLLGAFMLSQGWRKERKKEKKKY
mgnify:FL=1